MNQDWKFQWKFEQFMKNVNQLININYFETSHNESKIVRNSLFLVERDPIPQEYVIWFEECWGVGSVCGGLWWEKERETKTDFKPDKHMAELSNS